MNGVLLAIGRERVKRRVTAMAKAIEPAVATAMAQQAQAIVNQMRSLVPKKTHALEESTDWTFGDPPKDAKFVTATRRPKLVGAFLRITIFSGSFKAYWARWVEFGTRARSAGSYRDRRGKKRDAGKQGHRATAAHPYFWPVWRANKSGFKRALTKAMKTAVKEGMKVH